jgi:hypothetical protein
MATKESDKEVKMKSLEEGVDGEEGEEGREMEEVEEVVEMEVQVWEAAEGGEGEGVLLLTQRTLLRSPKT